MIIDSTKNLRFGRDDRLVRTVNSLAAVNNCSWIDHRAFGSLRVTASLGSSRWSTSVFADARSSSYLLPIKAEVRRHEGIKDGDTATIRLELDD